MADAEDDDLLRSFREGRFDRLASWPRPTYQLTRFAFLRLLGLVYVVAFAALVRQGLPLLGRDGLLPASSFLERVVHAAGSPGAAAARLPTLFWLSSSDAMLVGAAWIGLALAVAVLFGVTNAFVQLALWAIYGSFVHVGQIFYGYGWESLLLEAGFLSIFLCPMSSLRPLPASAPPPVVIWLLRWLVFRVMLGAGLIKVRGDPCWRDLTCLVYQYETQPVPNPVSALLHHLPRWFHALGVMVNHLVELVAPWLCFGPRRLRHPAGWAIVLFQAFLIASGNLSFLNWLTIAVAVACFDDQGLERLVPARWRERVRSAAAAAAPPPRSHLLAARALAVVVALLSLNPVLNMLSPRQAMNATFDPLGLVSTYGAFGGVGRQRYEVILEGTSAESPDENAVWREYELPCKPGDVTRRPCVISPYHYRLDWQLWFAAMSDIDHEPWLVHLVDKLLRGDHAIMRLFATDPFPDEPPRWVRASLYRYELLPWGDGSGAWWRRTWTAEYLRPVSRDDAELDAFVRARGWR